MLMNNTLLVSQILEIMQTEPNYLWWAYYADMQICVKNVLHRQVGKTYFLLQMKKLYYHAITLD